MLANYHTHTYRCHHAFGDDEEYIKKAIAEGLKILGFSDHAPYLYPNGYVSYYKMTPEESHEYFSSLRLLRDKYRDKIEIHIGYETEYYPSLWNDTLDFWRNTNPPEYLILGQHFIREEYSEEEKVHSAKGSERDMHLKIYVDTVTEAIKTGKFTYIAHPDIINYQGNNIDYYREQMARIITAAKSMGIPLEINMLGLRAKRNYPSPIFWETASKFNPDVVIGCDAHEPERVADSGEIAEALRFAEKYHLNLLDRINLVNVFTDK